MYNLAFYEIFLERKKKNFGCFSDTREQEKVSYF